MIAKTLASSLLLCACALDAQVAVPTRTPTIDQSLEMHAVAQPRISPDGTRVLYQQSRTNWEANAFETDVWLANVATGESHLLTLASKSSTSAEWSPDGRWIAFLSDRQAPMPGSPADKKQLYVMPADGGEAQQLTKMEKGVNDFEWAPDSQKIALLAQSPDSKAMKDRKDTFGDYHVFHADYQMQHLWLLTLPKSGAMAEEPKLLTSTDAFSVGEFSFSQDGTRIAFSAQRDPDLISAFSSDIYVVTLADMAVKKIVDTPGPDHEPTWSPDSSQIAYVTSDANKFFFYANTRIAVVPSGGGQPKVLTSSFDEDASIARWAPEGIYFSARQKTAAGLFLLDTAAGTAKQIELPGTELASQFSFSKDFKHVAYVGSGANQYAEVYAADLPAAKPAKLTHAGEQLSAFDTAKRSVVRWKSTDGTTIEGILYQPTDFVADEEISSTGCDSWRADWNRLAYD